MNKENLQKCIDAIENEKANDAHIKFDMGTFLIPFQNDEIRECGTVCCVAGTAYLLSKRKDKELHDSYRMADEFLGFDDKYYSIRNELYFARSMEVYTGDGSNNDDGVTDGYVIISENYQHHALDALKWMLANDRYNWKEALTAIGAIK